ncbi:NAD(P)H-quinone oxidoreductase [Ammoniphilus resinae]|uniref:PIG3 family NAD(P)H quinone oxidoreductase n=1 Tax=Ammoniphilus resinae TaxID=861532 RepID=A0ABS4GTT9_9BACL|nr:NAD(P)H-quinone oxidoreductase [Ammoniphilus resinae]MBP1933695.1 putative PIG3 family NAD(P)H quinone oxidoreductase [Ammoniphilus resinae]
MKAVLMNGFGGTEVLSLGNTSDPVIDEQDLLVRVRATALNRADLLQRRGMYPPPKGASEILGLEMAGVVVKVGNGVQGWKVGDRVCSLLPGGGYAELVSIPAGMAMRIPENLSFEEGAAIPEVFLTAYLNLFWLGNLHANQKVLVHAGASGVGTAAIQLIREAGAGSWVTAGSQEKIERCLELGAVSGWNYHNGSFLPWIREETKQEGVDIIFDFIGEPYFVDNLKSLAMDGRLIIIGTMGGAKVGELNLSQVLSRRLQIIGTALRSRSPEDKIRLTKEFADFALPRFSDGRMRPIIDTVFDWEDVAKAHAYMESNANVGKIILRVNES